MSRARTGTVRKVFTDTSTGGSDTAYWEGTWDAIDLDSERAQVLSGPVTNRLDSYLHMPGSLVLEAGCGTGAVAVALGTMGHRVVGLDLAEQTLRRARRTWPDFRGAVGDVCRMPFPDESFDAVISLGVLEHNESGPQAALEEHRRILRPGGVLLVTVPRISPLKAARDAWNLTVMRRDGYESRGRWVVRRDAVFAETSDRSFHQYEFHRADWQSLVRQAGFKILDSRPHGVGAGLGDLTLLPALRGGVDETVESSETAGDVVDTSYPARPPERSTTATVKARLSRLKSAVTGETASNRVEDLLVRGAQYSLGHMDLTVARRV